MKFIFPQNYNFNSKIFGIIEYSSAIFDLIWGFIIFKIINLFFLSLSLKISLFIILVFPIIIISIVGLNGENIIFVIIYVSKYFFKTKLLLYNKEKNI